VIRVTHAAGITTVTLDSDTAGVLYALICAARPKGTATHGALCVEIRDTGAPPDPKPLHKAIDQL
jgi:hypothetical protein